MSTSTGAETPDQTEQSRIDAFFESYVPKCLPAHLWEPLRPEVADLVRTAGPARLQRVSTDSQAIAAVVAHIHGRGRPLVLAELLTDEILVEFDQAIVATMADKSRENLRGRLRRLRAAHAGLPWRKERCEDGEAASKRPGPHLVGVIAAIDRSAAEDPGSEAAMAWREVIGLARRNGSRTDSVDEQTWKQARRFARACGTPVSKNQVRAAVVHSLLRAAEPLAVVAVENGLTRRDLDLATTHDLATGELDEQALKALRGAAAHDMTGVVSSATTDETGTCPQ